ncbi:MAG: divergent polysaccharide deacetylase family protein [Salinarimonadaceae bacterium]|nr:MAG: divergent polysaccharide deacetylase family protein [Salinarimonadaceae bacterium]
MSSDSASDDLTKPLAGARRRADASRAGSAGFGALPWRRILGSILGIFIVALFVFFSVADDPLGGEPHALAPIEERPEIVAENGVSGSARIVEAPRDRPGATAVEVESRSGVTVVRPDGTGAPQSIIIDIPDAAPMTGDASARPSGRAQLTAPAPYPELLERSRFGLLPRIGTDGRRASSAYARPTPAGAASHPARVAILITGLGVSLSATNDAIARLPPEATLAFAPYGGDLDRLVERARAAGHEVMLQAPMEPFDYPNSDPGPHTLTVSAQSSANVEKLRWVMGRFAGYTGIVNFMGARFTADRSALRPILDEIAGRGLAIVDDGASPRSLILHEAQAAGAPAARADVVLDAVPRAEAIDAMLAQLEEQARRTGFAIGSASALPVSVERIARWAQEAGGRGLLLVPVSAGFRNEVGG